MEKTRAEILRTPFVEIVKESFGDIVISSDLRDATEDDIKIAQELHDQGKCPHNICIDEEGWPYDYRFCYTCGKGKGLV